MAETEDRRLLLDVARVDTVALGVKSFELVDPRWDELPPYTVGAHIEVFLPQSLRRRYSLYGDPADRRRYLIAVLRQEQGGGGSRFMHDRLRRGDSIEVSPPRNNFPFIEGADEYVFIAGGIGVTPILPMVNAVLRAGKPFTLHYCARSRDTAAFGEQLARLCKTGQLCMHLDGGDPSKGLDVRALLSGYQRGARVYCCGPSGLMAAVREAARAWPQDRLHFEYFSAPDSERAAAAGEFEIVVKSRDLKLRVPPGKSIVDVLRAAGIEVETSCEAGVCGTCRARYLSGRPIHNDFVLSDHEKTEYVMLCCARASGEPLKLDL